MNRRVAFNLTAHSGRIGGGAASLLLALLPGTAVAQAGFDGGLGAPLTESEPPEARRDPAAPNDEPGAAVEPRSVELQALEREAVEVTVRAASRTETLRQSAEAVKVVETTRARQASADLGEVLSREAGLNVRRSGGLGMPSEFSLNGLSGDQVRFFLDGVPLEMAGFGLGIANVPVNLVEHVEVFRGVVPIRFGADALGGAVNLVSDTNYRGTHASASHSYGSFNTHRATLNARHHAKPSGFFARANGFFDKSDNDYRMHAQVADPMGRVQGIRARRFHDGYRAFGAGLQLGFVQRPWAKRLLLDGYVTDLDKELQHDLNYAVAASLPWGQVRRGERVLGSTLRFEKSDSWLPRMKLALLAAYAQRELGFRDASQVLYNWYGVPFRMRPQFPGQPQTGERGREATDTVMVEHRSLARADVGYRIDDRRQLRLNATFHYARRAGEDHLRFDPTQRDPLRDSTSTASLVLGLEYESRAFDERLENVAFVKDYIYHASGMATELLVRSRKEFTAHTQGAGDAVRWRFADWIWAKASYEYASRLPRGDEVFGSPKLVDANAELRPERSHNGNLGLTVDLRRSDGAAYRADLNAFVRRSSELIRLLLRPDEAAKYFNFRSARILGAELSAGWTSPRRYFELDGNVTYLDARIIEAEGAYATFNGDRLPNQPWLFFNGSARAQLEGVATETDELALTWIARYVHAFYLGWESGGQDKAEIAEQLQHTLLLSYRARAAAELSWSAELQNLTDAQLYDYFGIPKAGRAFFTKVALAY